MAWTAPKTDWTDDDFYNFGDLDRVESNTAHIAGLMLLTMTTVINRTRERFEFYDSMNRIEGNIKTLADNFYAPAGWESPKLNWESGTRFDWRDARRLENNLLLLYNLLSITILNYKYCGTFSCGEDVI